MNKQILIPMLLIVGGIFIALSVKGVILSVNTLFIMIGASFVYFAGFLRGETFK